MKLFDKLKDALFEEEVVDEPEDVKPQKPSKNGFKSSVDRIKEKTRVRDVKVTNYDDNDRDDFDDYDTPVAKKIVYTREKEEKFKEPPVRPEIKREVRREEVRREEIRPEKKSDFTFPAVDDSFFEKKEEKNVVEDDIPTLDFEDEKPERKHAKEEVKESKPYGGASNHPYQTDSTSEYVKKYTSSEYGIYPKSKEKHAFKPSPNISPVYGIIDDPVPDTQVEEKKEIRLTSALSNEKVDIDEVRRKALGLDSVDDNSDDSYDSKDNDIEEDVIDLTNSSAPSVNKVTMGDAEEYYDDLGLEYNNDYIDAGKNKSRVKSDEEYEKEKTEDNSKDSEDVSVKKEEKEEKRKVDTKKSKDSKDDDNLFDLIDSMYDNK